MQDAGHINIESGHGEWPLGIALLQSLAGDASLTAGRLDFSSPQTSSSSSASSFGSLETA